MQLRVVGMGESCEDVDVVVGVVVGGGVVLVVVGGLVSVTASR